jgi:hypothetical protein
MGGLFSSSSTSEASPPAAGRATGFTGQACASAPTDVPPRRKSYAEALGFSERVEPDTPANTPANTPEGVKSPAAQEEK